MESQDKTQGHRLRQLRLALIVTMATFVLTILSGIIYLDTDAGRRHTVELINKKLTEDNSNIQISELNGSVFSNFSVPSIRMADVNGQWLEIRNIDVEWSPRALLNGKLLVSLLSIESIEIIRKPISSEQEAGENEFEMPKFPVDLEVSNFNVTSISLNEPFADVVSQFELNGVLKLTENEGIHAKAELLSKTDLADQVILDVLYPGSSSDLKINLGINAPKDGVFVSLADIKTDEDISLKFSGDGPLDNWQGYINAGTINDVFIDGNISLTNNIFSADLKFDVRKFVPKEYLTLFGETNSLSLSYNQSEFNADLVTRFGSINAKGGNSLQIFIDIKDPEPINDLLSPIHLAPMNIEGTVENVLSDPKLHFQINDMGIRVDDRFGSFFSGDISAAFTSGEIKINSQGRMDDISGEFIEPVKNLISKGIEWDLDARFDQSNSIIGVNTLTMTNDLIHLKGDAEYKLSNGSLASKLNITLNQLPMIWDETDINQKISGAVFINADLARSDINSPLEADLHIDSKDIQTGNTILDDLLGPSPGFSSHITLLNNGGYGINDTILTARHIKMVAQAAISQDQEIHNAGFNVSLVQIEDIKAIGNIELAGQLDIVGELSGNLNSPSLVIETGFDSLNIQNLQMREFTTQLEIDDLINNLNGKLIFKSKTNFGNFNGETSFKKIEEDYQVSVLNISLGNYLANGGYNLSTTAAVVGAMAIITVDTPQHETNINGLISADLKFSEENNAQKIVLEGTLNGFKYRTPRNEEVVVDSAMVLADVLFAPQTPIINFEAKIDNLLHPDIQSKNMIINVDQKENILNYNINMTGNEAMPYQIDAEGILRFDDGNERFITIGIDGMIGNTPIGIEEPAEVYFNNDDFEIRPFALKIGEGQLKAGSNKSGDKLDAFLSMNNVDMAPISVFSTDLPASGLMTGNIQFNVEENRRVGDFDIVVSDIVLSKKSIFSDNRFNFKAKGQLNNNSADINGTMGVQEYFNANYSAALPLEIGTNTLIPELSYDKAINGHLNWKGDIAPIWPVLQNNDHELAGQLDAELNFSGTLSTPNVDGVVHFSNGHYENMQTGFIAEDMAFEAQITDRRLVLERFEATDGEEGAIKASADIMLQPDLDYSVEAELILANTHIVRLPELEITASSNLKFEKNEYNARLSGEISAENANIGTIEQGAPVIAKLDVTEINKDGVVSENGQQAGKNMPIDLNLKLNVPSKLFIVSYGLDSEWQAELEVTGTSEKPIVSGNANLVRGFFEFSGKRFDLKNGSFIFPGDESNDPVIEVSAEHQLIDMTVNLRIFGRASKPSLELSSTPYLPENEIMARVLFGTSVAQLTPVEAVQLASAIHSLSTGGGQGWMGGIRRAIGVDRLSIENDASREYGTTITGGKYLTDNIYVEVSTAPATGKTATSVEVGLNRNLSLVTRRTLAQDNNLSIKWSWDY